MRLINDSLSFLETLKPEKIKPGLERITFLLKELGEPQKEFSAIHISGTNGKGSTLAFLDSIYCQAGYLVGAFTSPHLYRVNERLKVGEEFVSDSELKSLIEEVKPVFLKAAKRKDVGRPSYFEFLAAMAFLYFARRKVDLALVEVGIEGRFDATNLVNAVATIITQIEMEHQDYLGDSYSQVLKEAISIIRKGVPVVSAEKKAKAVWALKNESQKKKARLFILKETSFIKEVKKERRIQIFDYQGIFLNLRGLQIKLLGKHQIENASLALLTTEILQPQFPVFEEHLRQGLKEAFWPARFEVHNINRGWLVIDGAHNPSGLKVLLRALKRHFPNLEPAFVFGVLKDKDYRTMASILAPHVKEIFLVKPLSSRALPSFKLKKEFLGYNQSLSVKMAKSLGEAINLACQRSKLVVVAGSLYLAAQAREVISAKGAFKE